MKSSQIFAGLVVFQTGIIVGLVADSYHGGVATADAQLIPDPAAQQMQTNELLKGIDAKLGKVAGALDAELKVKVSNLPETRPQH